MTETSSTPLPPPSSPAPVKQPSGLGTKAASVLGWIFMALGGGLAGFGALVFLSVAGSDDPAAGWSIFISIPLVMFGLIFLMIGGSILLTKNTWQARRALRAGEDSAAGTAERSTMPFAVAGLCLAILPILGLGFSLYAFFAGRPGSSGRRLGLFAVLTNLAVMALSAVL